MAQTNANASGPEMNVDLALELFSIAGSLNSTTDLDFLLQKIGAAAEQLLDSEASAIMLVTDDMLMIEPPPAAAIAGMAERQVRIVPSRSS